MANRKEYEMLFQLQAQLSNSFNSTFGTARNQMTAIQREIQALHSAQSDISAYQKQQGAVEATQKKLEVLQQQYDNIQREIQETEGYSSSLENQLLSKQMQIDKTSASLEKETQKLDAMGNELTEAGVDTQHLTSESERLTNEIEALRKEEEQAATQSKSFGEQSVEAFDAISSAIVAAGVATALKEIAEGYMQCVNAAQDFEATMSTVEALSGATGDELASLTAMAKELGATTKFTANESAEAMTYMAMAGWDAQAMLNGMDGVLQLAAASGEDLATVSDIVTDNLSAFGLTAADTAHFSDVLAAAATSSNTSVSIMGETFKNSAALAGALGYSVEDVAVAVGLMANAGIKGSNAGTALKNVFNGLLEGVTLTSEAFGEIEFSAINADGTMKSFGETINELRGYFAQMTGAEQLQNAAALAGQRAMSGFVSIMNAADGDFDALAASIYNCNGAAAEMAAIKMDNAQGELTLMQSAWEGLTISIGEKFTPEMRKLYALGAQVFSGLSEFVDKNPATVKAVAAFTAVVGTATAGLTAYAAISKVVKALDMAAIFASPAGAAIMLGAGIVAVSTALATLAYESTSAQREFDGLTATSQNQYRELQNLQAAYDEAAQTYGATSEEALRLKYQVDDLSASYEASKQSVQEFAAECDSVVSANDEIVSAYRDSMSSQKQSGIETFALIQKLSDLAGETEQTAGTQQAMTAIINELNGAYQGLNLTYDDVIANTDDAVEALKQMAQAQAEQEDYQASYEAYVSAYKEQLEIDDQLQKAKDEQVAAQQRYNEALEQYNALVDSGADFLFDDGGLSAATADLNAANQAVENLTAAQAENAALQDELLGKWDELDKAAQESAAATSSAAMTYEEAVSEAWSSVEADIMALCEAYDEAYNSAYDSFSGQYDLWDKVGEISKTTISDLNAALDSQIAYWESYSSNLAELHSRNIEGLDELVASMDDGSEESAAALAAMASASDEELSAMVSKYGDLQNAQSDTAAAVAELETDFTARMEEMQSIMESTVDEMNMSADAAAAAKSTMDAYIQELTTKGNQAVSEAQDIARRISSALSSASASAPSSSIPGYATGTTSAAPGFAMVGENGPELMYFNGGEKILNATETAALQQRISSEEVQAISLAPQLMQALSATTATQAVEAMPVEKSPTYNINLSFTPSYNLSGAANTADVQTMLEQSSVEMKEFILQTIQEAMEDAKRSGY